MAFMNNPQRPPGDRMMQRKKVDITRPLEERTGRPSLINDRQRQLY